jgi:hypothetical protein
MPVLIGDLRPRQRWEHDEVPLPPSPKTASPMGKPQKETARDETRAEVGVVDAEVVRADRALFLHELQAQRASGA